MLGRLAPRALLLLASAAGPARRAAAAASMPPKRKASAAVAAPSADGADGAPTPAKAAPAAASGDGAAATACAPKPAPPPAGTPYDAVGSRAPPLAAGAGFRALSWNVAGLRGLLKKDPSALARLVAAERPDALLLQEHKLQETHCAEVDAALAAALPGWRAHWSCSTDKKGYSGVALLAAPGALPSAIAAGLPGHDGEGRVLTAEYDAFFLVNVYVPNAGEGLKRLDYRVGEWDAALAAHVAGLEARGKPVILAGDLNVAAQEIDIHSPKTNLRSAGFTVEERGSFAERLLGAAGLVDTFRARHPGIVAYSYYGYRGGMRAKGKGWRLDYFLVGGALAPAVHDAFMLPEVMGSDHLPVGLVLDL